MLCVWNGGRKLPCASLPEVVMWNVACAVTVTMDRSLGWQCSVPVKVSVTLSCVVIVMGVRAEAAPAAAKATKAASMNATMMRLITHLLSSTEVTAGFSVIGPHGVKATDGPG